MHCGRQLAGCSRLLSNMTSPARNRPHPQQQVWLRNCLLAFSSSHSDSHSPTFISLSFIISLSFHSPLECMIAVYHLSHRVDFPATHHTTPVQQYTPESSTATVTIWSCFNYPWSVESILNEIYCLKNKSQAKNNLTDYMKNILKDQINIMIYPNYHTVYANPFLFSCFGE